MRHAIQVTTDRLDDFDDIVDVRSPSEFALDHVPGAMNCPVLDDEERARVGTLYKQVSQFDARKLGAALVAKNIALHLEQRFAAKDPGWKPLVYCWRGGKRSGSMAHILREVGWHAATLDGGYRAYRRAVLAHLETLPPQYRFRVVCGPTGSGKSRLLQALAARGAQVLDLEDLARHRGSVLGDLPGEPQPSQKMFDSLIWDMLRRLDPARVVLVEAESKKVGLVRVPDVLLLRMRGSPCVRIDAPMAERVKFLIREYRHFLAGPGWLKAQLLRLTALHSHDTVERWCAQADRGEWEPLVGDLLSTHYDPAYLKSTGTNFPSRASDLHLQAPDLGATAFDALATTLLERLEQERNATPESTTTRG